MNPFPPAYDRHRHQRARRPRMLVPEERPVPQPGPGEILVKVAAAGVNRPDVMQRQGLYPPPKGAPDIPGLEIAGEVVALRRQCHALEAGRQGDGAGRRRRLCGILPRARRPCAARAAELFRWRKPAAIPETFFTVWHNVFERGALKAARRCWCMAAPRASAPPPSSSPRLSARRSSPPPARRRNAKPRASSAPISRSTTRPKTSSPLTKAATDGKGADVILDMIGGDYIERNYEAAARRRAHRADRLPGLAQGDGEFHPHHAQAPASHRLDAAVALG